MDTSAIHYLPQGFSFNCCLAHPKDHVVPVIVMNQNNQNIWIWQPLLAAEMFWVEHLPWDYREERHQEGQNIEVVFQPLPIADIMASVHVHDEPSKVPPVEKEASQESCPTFEPHPNTQVADFNVKKEVECFPFKLKLGDVPLEKEYQDKFINLIFSNLEVLFLHDEDFFYCDCLTHTILTSTDKPVYLLHRTILRQLQGKVYECLNTYLCPGIIHPSNSQFASQSQVMAEDDIKKSTFRAGSSGLYEFTHMPFGLSNAGSSFCRLMEQCLGNQQPKKCYFSRPA